MNLSRAALSATLSAVVLAVVACGQPPGPASGGDLRAEVADITWILEEGHGPDGAVAPSPDARVTLHVDADEDAFGGVSACNHYGGSFRLDGTRVRIDELHGTDMGCEPDTMTVEQRYLAALQRVDRLAVEEDRLHLAGDGTDLRFARLPDAPTADLLGTTWQLESIGQGHGDDTPVTQATDPARLRLDDGSLALTSSCVEVEAAWVQQGAEYRISESRYDYADEHADCLHDDPEQQALLSAFDGAFTADLDGDRLTLAATRGDAVLYFRAAD